MNISFLPNGYGEDRTGALIACELRQLAPQHQITAIPMVSNGDAFVLCLDGTGEVTIDGVPHTLEEGSAIVMPADVPHAVFGKERFKMLLIVAF